MYRNRQDYRGYEIVTVTDGFNAITKFGSGVFCRTIEECKSLIDYWVAS